MAFARRFFTGVLLLLGSVVWLRFEEFWLDGLLSLKATPQKNVSYDSYLFGCTFQHPREWQVGHAFDSGGVALTISDADPIEVFGFANRTGNEIVIALFGGGDAKADFVPVTFLEKLGKEPINSKIHKFNEGDKQFAYVLNSGELRAAMINQQKAFWIQGDYPIDKESVVQAGLETILRSFELLKVEGWELSNELPLGARNEGPLITDLTREGYLPFWAMSVWTFEGKAISTTRLHGTTRFRLVLRDFGFTAVRALPV